MDAQLLASGKNRITIGARKATPNVLILVGKVHELHSKSFKLQPDAVMISTDSVGKMFLFNMLANRSLNPCFPLWGSTQLLPVYCPRRTTMRNLKWQITKVRKPCQVLLNFKKPAFVGGSFHKQQSFVRRNGMLGNVLQETKPMSGKENAEWYQAIILHEIMVFDSLWRPETNAIDLPVAVYNHRIKFF